MTRPVIVTKAGKGQALTFNELDANFNNLQDAKINIETGFGGTKIICELNGNITLVAGSGITITGDAPGNSITIAATGQNGTFPTVRATNQLFSKAYTEISGTISIGFDAGSVGAIDRTTIGTNYPAAGKFTTLSVNPNGTLRFESSNGVGYYQSFQAGVLTQNTTWTLPAADGTSDQVLTTNGSGQLRWTNPGATLPSQLSVTYNASTQKVLAVPTAGNFLELSDSTRSVFIPGGVSVVGTSSRSVTVSNTGQINLGQGSTAPGTGVSWPATITGELSLVMSNSTTQIMKDYYSGLMFIHNASTGGSALYMLAGLGLNGTTTIVTVSTTGTGMPSLATSNANNGISITNSTGSTQAYRIFTIRTS